MQKYSVHSVSELNDIMGIPDSSLLICTNAICPGRLGILELDRVFQSQMMIYRLTRGKKWRVLATAPYHSKPCVSLSCAQIKIICTSA